MPDPQHLISNVDDARRNVRRYGQVLRQSNPLQDIMSYARGWYACRDEAGEWALAPSKFAGYADNDAESYLRFHQERDGRLSERLLRQWFVEVAPGTPVFEELIAVLSEMFARTGRTPNKRLHLHVLKSDLTVAAGAESKDVQRSKEALLQRVTSDPDILGGRPIIRGLRISVSDILDLVASGASREEILADFPYLEADDISAALEYAARSVDHRVVRAA